MKKDSKDWIDKRAPKHLSSSVLSGALYIHNGKDTQDKLDRTERVLKKIGPELATYVRALLTLPQLMEQAMQSTEYKDFKDKYQSHTFH